MKKLSVPLAAIGLSLVIVAALYLFMPVNTLPGFLPGYDPLANNVQYQHGVAPLILGVGLLTYGWLQHEKQ